MRHHAGVPHTRWQTRRRLIEGEAAPWLALLVAGRAMATAVAVGLIVLEPTIDSTLLVLTAYGVISAAAIAVSPRLRSSPLFWIADTATALACVLASGDWRSPFYVLWLTTLALPAVKLPLRQAIWLALLAPLLYLSLGLFGGPAPGALRPITSETLVIHLLLPAVLVAGLAYATYALQRLQEERTRHERLAIEAERRRIAWELHDSAKQRLHAAHLLVSSLHGRVDPELVPAVERASVELESAAADMDTSLAELRSPLEGRPLHTAIEARARELVTDGGPTITVRGEAPPLPPLVAAHAYRIASEALTNALRHAEASTIEVTLERTPGGLRIGIVDDGRGLPETHRPHATGILAMQSRAESIGARLVVASRDGQPGTRVVVDLPAGAPRPQGATA